MFQPQRNRNPFGQPFAYTRRAFAAALPVDATAFAALWIAGVGMFADAAMTTPQAADGGVIKGWQDQSANGYHLTQPGADSISPILRSSVSAFNNRAAVEFDGGDHLLRTLAGITANASTYTIYVVARTSSANTNMVTYGEASTSSTTPYVWVAFNRLGTRVGYEHRSDASVFISAVGNTGGNDNVSRLYAARRSGASGGSLRQNAVSINSDPDQPGVTTVSRLGMGAQLSNTIASFFTGQIAMVGITLADDFATQEALIAAYYNIAI